MRYRNRKRTAEEIKRDKAIREGFQSARPALSDLVRSGEYTEPIPQGSYLALMKLLSGIKRLREEQHLSLSDVAEKTGIDKAQLSRLENGQIENPTFQTLERVASALGKRIEFELHDDSTAGAR